MSEGSSEGSPKESSEASLENSSKKPPSFWKDRSARLFSKRPWDALRTNKGLDTALENRRGALIKSIYARFENVEMTGTMVSYMYNGKEHDKIDIKTIRVLDQPNAVTLALRKELQNKRIHIHVLRPETLKPATGKWRDNSDVSDGIRKFQLIISDNGLELKAVQSLRAEIPKQESQSMILNPVPFILRNIKFLGCVVNIGKPTQSGPLSLKIDRSTVEVSSERWQGREGRKGRISGSERNDLLEKVHELLKKVGDIQVKSGDRSHRGPAKTIFARYYIFFTLEWDSRNHKLVAANSIVAVDKELSKRHRVHLRSNDQKDAERPLAIVPDLLYGQLFEGRTKVSDRLQKDRLWCVPIDIKTWTLKKDPDNSQEVIQTFNQWISRVRKLPGEYLYWSQTAESARGKGMRQLHEFEHDRSIKVQFTLSRRGNPNINYPEGIRAQDLNIIEPHLSNDMFGKLLTGIVEDRHSIRLSTVGFLEKADKDSDPYGRKFREAIRRGKPVAFNKLPIRVQRTDSIYISKTFPHPLVKFTLYYDQEGQKITARILEKQLPKNALHEELYGKELQGQIERHLPNNKIRIDPRSVQLVNAARRLDSNQTGKSLMDHLREGLEKNPYLLDMDSSVLTVIPDKSTVSFQIHWNGEKQRSEIKPCKMRGSVEPANSRPAAKSRASSRGRQRERQGQGETPASRPSSSQSSTYSVKRSHLPPSLRNDSGR